MEKIESLLKELYYKAYQKSNPHLGCLTRAQLLFLRLKEDGYHPKIMKYTVEGNDKKNFEGKEKISHISGHEFPSHIVVLLEGYILDANITRVLPEEEYEKKIISYKPKEKLIFIEETSKIDMELCKQCANKFNLSSFNSLFE